MNLKFSFIVDINDDIELFYVNDFTIMVNKSISNKIEENLYAQNIYAQIFDIKENKRSSDRRNIMDGTIKKKSEEVK